MIISRVLQANTVTMKTAVLVLLTVLYFLLIVLQQGIVDTADGVLHYQYARFALEHPENAFNHWAKPLFTMLMIVPAQFGIKGVAVVNVFLVVLSSHLVMNSATRLGLSNAWVVGLLTGLGSALSYVVLGGLTEPLFILSLSSAVYLAIRGSFKWMYLILGASVLVRPEAIVIIPILGLYGLYKRARKAAVYGMIVPISVSLLGVIIADLDWFWIITGQPYQIESIYGNGTWLHYYNSWQRIAPYSLLYGAIVGTLCIPFSSRKLELTVIASCGFGILLLHVFLWKFGKMGSAGVVRTLSTAIPALALIVGFLLDKISQRHRWLLWLFMAFFLLEVVVSNQFPKPIQERELAARAMAESIKSRLDVDGRTIAYQFAATAYYLDLDPFEPNQSVNLWSLDREVASMTLKDGDILIWDNFTGSREGQLPWQRISSDPNAMLLDSITLGQTTLVSFQISK